MLSNLVVDSSVIVKWLNQENEEQLEQAETVLKDATSGKVELFAPELAKYEVVNALIVGKKLAAWQIKEALSLYYSLSISFVTDSLELATVASKFVDKFHITYYDASFVALARNLDATLVTANPKHQAKVKGVKVVSLEDYK